MNFYYGEAYDEPDPGTFVYVDGFNLFYGCLKGTPYRWLDLGKFCDLALPNQKVSQVRYFTARVSARPDKPTSHTDQMAYLRALFTDHRVTVQYGQFLVSRKLLPRADRPNERVKVIKTDEKGSDVNLAVALVHDAAQGLMNEAVVITNDSDLVGPIRLVRQEYGIPVGVLNPHATPSHQLISTASWVRPIKETLLQQAQFPQLVQELTGKRVHRPKGWDQWSAKGSFQFKPPHLRPQSKGSK